MPRLPYAWIGKRKKVRNYEKTKKWYKEIKP
jgi:hypothetical protein